MLPENLSSFERKTVDSVLELALAPPTTKPIFHAICSVLSNAETETTDNVPLWIDWITEFVIFDLLKNKSISE